MARSIPLMIAAVGLWLTAGVVSPVGVDATDRIAVLPPAWIVPVLLLGATAVAWVSPWAPARLRPLYFSALVWLPWLPAPIPAAFLLWHGPLAMVVWTVAAALLVAPLARRWWARVRAAPVRTQTALAVVVAAAVYLAAAWRMAPALPGGDEPHYLVITQSLLYDGDLRIENNHQRREYRAYIADDIKPDYLRRGIDREIYSVHAPGLSALVLPAFAAGGYPVVVLFLAIVSALGAALAWHAAWRITKDAGAAWAGWAAVALTAPFLFQAVTVYPDGPGAVLVMTGAYVLACPERLAGHRWRTAAHGLALAALPWLHTRYAVLAGLLGAFIVSRLLWPGTRERDASRARGSGVADGLAFLAAPVLSAAAWFWTFHAIYGTFNPTAPYGTYTQTSLANVPRGLAGLVVDQQFGLVPNAPVYLSALAGAAALWRTHRRLAIELALTVLAYAVAVALYQMWWGGRSSPVRFLVPALLPFALAVAAAWSRSSPSGRAAIAALLATSVGLAAALAWVDRGALVYNFRDGFALWMDWVAPLVSLPRAAPTLFRNARNDTAWMVAAWVAAAGASWWLARRVTSRVNGGESAGAWLALACTLVIGSTVAWRIVRAQPLESGTGLVRVLQAAAGGSDVTRLPGLRRASAADGMTGLRLPTASRRDRSPGGELFLARDLPAGSYRVVAYGHSVSGILEAAVGCPPIPVLRAAVSGSSGQASMRLDLPAGAKVLAIHGDEAARRSVHTVVLELDRLDASVEAGSARTFMRYGDVTAWFVDDGAFAEPAGWWVGGRASAAVLIDTVSTQSSVGLLVRNGAVRNRATLTSGNWSITLDLAAGEERPIDVPLTNGRGRLRVRSAAGFRPSEWEPASDDSRLLGVWLQPR